MRKIKNAAAGIRIWFQANREAGLFLVAALFAGIAMAYVNPPFQECDGGRHYLWALDVSYGNLLRPLANISSHEDGMITVPENLDEVEFRPVEPWSGEGRQFVRHLKTVRFSETLAEMRQEGAFASLFYYPQALGFWLGRVFRLSVYGSVILSRMFNLAAFLSLSYWAIRIIPILKNILAVAALFPMTIYQAASDSPDAMLNGMCFLFTALCFYYAYGEKQFLSWRDMWKPGLLLGLIFLCKYVYVCLGLLVFLIPVEKFGSRRKYWKSFGLGLIPLLVVGGAGMINMISAVSGGQAGGGGEITQTGYLLAHPFFIVKVLAATFKNKFNDYMLWLNTLGNQNYPLGPLIFMVPMFAMFIGAADRNEKCDGIKIRDKLICLTAFAAVCAGVVLGLYIGDGKANEVGGLVVQGVQGRYFIPALPVFFGAVSLRGVRNKNPHFTEKAIGGMGVFLLYAICTVYSCCF